MQCYGEVESFVLWREWLVNGVVFEGAGNPWWNRPSSAHHAVNDPRFYYY